MIRTLLFDFGDVFINLDKTAPTRMFAKLGNPDFVEDIAYAADMLEIGNMTTQAFVNYIWMLFPKASKDQILDAWNSILLDFPNYRLQFLKKLAASKKYKLLLLSNTNEAHISWIEGNVPFYEEFKSCFDTFYLSHEIQMRKPGSAIFEHVLQEQQILPEETLFIDDTPANTEAADKLGFHTWNIDPDTEDVIHLFTFKSGLF